MNKRDIEGFKEVLLYLKEKQKGIFGIDKLNKFDLCVLNYIDIGEGMTYETIDDYEFKELIETLNKEVEKNEDKK